MIPTLLKATQLWAHKNSNSSPNLLVTLFLRQFLFTVIYSSWVLITTKQIHQSWIRNYICGGGCGEQLSKQLVRILCKEQCPASTVADTTVIQPLCVPFKAVRKSTRGALSLPTGDMQPMTGLLMPASK